MNVLHHKNQESFTKKQMMKTQDILLVKHKMSKQRSRSYYTQVQGQGPAKNTINTKFGVINDLNSQQKHCLEKFINLCMKDGKKNKSYNILSKTLYRLSLFETLTEKHFEESAKLFIQKSKTSAIASQTYIMPTTDLIDDKSSHENLEKKNDKLQLQTSHITPLGIFLLINAVENVKPIIEVKKVRISGTTQQVPCIIPKKRQICLAIRWLIEAAILRRKTKKSLTLDQCFFAELVDAFHKIGAVKKKRDDIHKLAESNRGFAHYRWWNR